MKRLSLLIISSIITLGYVNAQTVSIPLKDGKVVYEGIVQMPEIENTQSIYKKAIAWFSFNPKKYRFINSDSTIATIKGEAGKFSALGRFNCEIIIFCSKGQYKYTLKNFGSYADNRAKSMAKQNDHSKKAFNEKVQTVISDLEDFMKSAGS